MNFKAIYFTNHKPINGILFLFALLLLVYYNPFIRFRYDCRVYWELTQQYGADGNFSLLHFNEALRGYLFPLLLYPSYFLSHLFQWNDVLTCRIFLALVYSFFYAYGTGVFFRKIFRKILHPFLHALLGFIFLFLWWEYFTLPLSDAAGLFFLLSAFVLCRKEKLVFTLLSGACLYAAMNIRLIYMVSIPFYLYAVIMDSVNIRILLKSILLSIIGFLTIAMPQCYINLQNFNTNTLFVPTQASKETGGKNLFLMQLNWGLRVQKYETNLGGDYPTPEVRYIDSVGEELSLLHGNKDFESYPGYFDFVLDHPVIFYSYLKHAFNGLDITTPKAYIVDGFYNRSVSIKVINFSLLFIGILGLIGAFRRINLFSKTLTTLMICLIAIIIPTAIEVRFFMPLHFLLYFYACYFFQSLSLNDIKKSRMKLLWFMICYSCFVSAGVYKSNNRMQQLEFNKTD